MVTRPQLLSRVPHDLRRTAVRNLTAAGVPKVWAKKLTGHRTDSVFDRYDIVEIGELREATRRLAGHTKDTLAVSEVSGRDDRLRNTLE